MFSHKSVGIDIADHTIEIAEISGGPNDFSVSKLSRVKIASGVVEKGRIKNAEYLKKAIILGLEKASPGPIQTKKIILGLPESQVYVHNFVLSDRDESIEMKIRQEALRNIPIREERLIYAFKLVNEKEVLLLATSKDVLLEWQEFFKKIGITIDYFDFEPLAIFRGIFHTPSQKPVCIVDIGAVTTNISIFNESNLFCSWQLQLAGEDFTEEIASSLGLSEKSAEEKKLQLGIADETNQIFLILTKQLESITKSVKKALQYSKDKLGINVDTIIFVGGSSKLKGLLPYLKASFDTTKEIKLGNSSLRGKNVPLEHLEAIGLALRGTGGIWDKDPVIRLNSSKTTKKNIDQISFKKEIPSKEQVLQMAKAIDSNKKPKLISKKRKFIIIFLVLVSAGLIIGYYSLFKSGGEKDNSEIPQFSQSQVLRLRIPLILSSQENLEGEISGRVVKNIIRIANGYEEALDNSRALAEKEIRDKEILWQNPISKVQVEFPMNFEWIVYEKESLKKAIKQNIENMKGSDQSDYELGIFEVINLTESEDPNVYYLEVDAHLSLDEKIKVETEELINSDVKINKVIINETETGWLNVRSAPGTNHEIMTRINPGETYPFLEKEEGWYKIEFQENSFGWIASRYASEL